MNNKLKTILRTLTSSPRRTLQTLIGIATAVFAASPLWTLLGAALTVMGALIDLVLIGALAATALVLVAKWRDIYDAARPELVDVFRTIFWRRPA